MWLHSWRQVIWGFSFNRITTFLFKNSFQFLKWSIFHLAEAREWVNWLAGVVWARGGTGEALVWSLSWSGVTKLSPAFCGFYPGPGGSGGPWCLDWWRMVKAKYAYVGWRWRELGEEREWALLSLAMFGAFSDMSEGDLISSTQHPKEACALAIAQMRKLS